MTWNGTGQHVIKVDDDDAIFNDDNDLSQDLAQDVTTPSVGALAGSAIEPQYGYLLEAPDGSQITIYVVDLRGNNPSGVTETVDGIVTTAPLQPGVTYTVTDVFEIVNPPYSSLVPCFTPGTLIAAPDGPVAVERIRPGMRILTADAGAQTVRWAGMRRLGPRDLAAQPNLRPIRIRAGALGHGLPARDMLVSPQHRMLVASKIATRMFGRDEVMVAAKHLCSLPGIAEEPPGAGVSYIHFLFDAHQVVFAEGAPTESLYPGPMALQGLAPEARAEITALFPDLVARLARGESPEGARPFLTARQARKLTERHARNRKPLLQTLRTGRAKGAAA